MLIIADKNIPLVEQAFSGLGELRLLDGRHLSNEDLLEADALLVRSVTRVNKNLLEGSPIRFVGSATSGIDHIDVDYLAERNTQFAYTPGNNAQAVAEYVISILVILAQQKTKKLNSKVLGVIGYGHIGKRVLRLAEALDIECLINDPFLQEQSEYSDVAFCDLDELLQCSDYVTLHTPLTVDGRFPTHHLINENRLLLLKDGASLINTARGGVVDNHALLAELQNGRIHAVLDVWEAEPDIDINVLEQVALGTPHVAGYSLEGKLNATAELHKALCRSFVLSSDWQAPLTSVELRTDFIDNDLDIVLPSLLGQVCALQEDDQDLHQLIELPVAERAVAFDRLRRNYSLRREFSAYRCPDIQDARTKQLLTDLGFSSLKID